MVWLAAGVVVMVLALVAGRWFVATPAADLAHALRTFVAVFGALAGGGLLMFGRVGLAMIVIAATIMAFRSLGAGRRGADPLPGAGPEAGGRTSTVETAWLLMRLDHGTGELAGEVRRGRLAGRRLGDLGLAELVDLLAEVRREDPGSVALLETYLDRYRTGWRDDPDRGGRDGGRGGGDEPMDEATALAILGLERGADAEAIKTAHRRLMARLHPDHGGSDWLASRINAARDYLLARTR